jgi:hypothetical protein
MSSFSYTYYPCVFSTSLQRSVLLNLLSIYHAWLMFRLPTVSSTPARTSQRTVPVSMDRTPAKNRTGYCRTQLPSVTAWDNAFGNINTDRSKICGIYTWNFLRYGKFKPIPGAARLLGLWVRIPLGAWLSASCECCVSSGTGLYDGPVNIQRSAYYRVWCVSETDREASIMWRLWPTRGGCSAMEERER